MWMRRVELRCRQRPARRSPHWATGSGRPTRSRTRPAHGLGGVVGRDRRSHGQAHVVLLEGAAGDADVAVVMALPTAISDGSAASDRNAGPERWGSHRGRSPATAPRYLSCDRNADSSWSAERALGLLVFRCTERIFDTADVTETPGTRGVAPDNSGCDRAVSSTTIGPLPLDLWHSAAWVRPPYRTVDS